MIFWMKPDKKKTSVRALVVREKQARRKQIVILLLCIITAIGICLGLYAAYSAVKIINIKCTLDSSVCPQELLESTSYFKGKSIFTSVNYSDPYYMFTIKKAFPNTLHFTFKTPKTIATVYNSATDSSQLTLTENGYALPLQERRPAMLRDARLLTIKTKTLIDQRVFLSIKDILGYIDQQLSAGLVAVYVENSNKILWDFGAYRAITDTLHLDTQMISLQLLQATPTIELNQVEIDLRFERPVVKTIGT